MSLNVGDFIITENSKIPGIIISKNKEKYLLSIHNKCSCYIIRVNVNQIKQISSRPYQKLIIIICLERGFINNILNYI